MKAVQLPWSIKVEDLKISEIEIPKVKDDWVLVKIVAFWLNHSEAVFRQFEIDKPQFIKPRVPWIECVWIVEDGSNTDLEKWEKVIALMWWMGRSFNWSYEEYALLPRKNVFKVNTNLDWIHLAAIPETFYTARGSLFSCLKLKKWETILVRAGSSALGIASIIIAKNLWCRVITTIRSENKKEYLESIWADKVIIDHWDFVNQLDGKVDKVLELVWAATVKESLKTLKVWWIVCVTWILWNVFTLDWLNPISDIPNWCYITGFHSNNPTQEIIDDMMKFIDENYIIPPIWKIYDFENVIEYSRDLENWTTWWKWIVIVDKSISQN